MIKKTIICLALAMFFASIVICTATPTISQGYDLANVSGYDLTTIPHDLAYDQTLNGMPTQVDTTYISSKKSPMGETPVEEPPASIPAASSPNKMPDKKVTNISPAAHTQASSGLAYYTGYAPDFALESWNGVTWTKDPIALPMGSTWWWRLINPDTQDIWFKENSAPWNPYTYNPMSPQISYGSTKIKKCGWNYVIAWGSQDSFTNRIWCHVNCPLKIVISPPGKQSPPPKTVTIKYSVNQDCTVQFVINQPDGPIIDNPISISSGTHSYTYFDPGPGGRRQIVGIAWTSSDSDVDKQEYTI